MDNPPAASPEGRGAIPARTGHPTHARKVFGGIIPPWQRGIESAALYLGKAGRGAEQAGRSKGRGFITSPVRR